MWDVWYMLDAMEWYLKWLSFGNATKVAFIKVIHNNATVAMTSLRQHNAAARSLKYTYIHMNVNCQRTFSLNAYMHTNL